MTFEEYAESIALIVRLGHPEAIKLAIISVQKMSMNYVDMLAIMKNGLPNTELQQDTAEALDTLRLYITEILRD